MATKEEYPGFEKIDWEAGGEEEKQELDQIPEQQAQEEKTEQPAQQEEEVKEDIKEDAVETKETQEPVKEDKTPEQVVDDKTFDITFFNKAFGTQFETEDSLKVALQSPSKVKELEAKLAEYETLKSDIEYYKNGFNPLDLFASEDDFRVQQFKKQNPDKDASVAYKVFTSDLSKADDLDVLIMYEMLQNPNLKGGEAGAKEVVADQYGLDMEDKESWSTLQENKLRKAANLARSEFKDMRNGIELPKNVNLKEQRDADATVKAEKAEQLKTKWNATLDNMFSHMDKVSISDTDAEGNKNELFHYVVDDKSKADLRQEISDVLLSMGKDVTEENIQEAGQYVYERFVLKNMSKMFKSYGNDLLAKQERVIDKDIHNAEKVTTDVKPDSDAEKDKAEFIKYALGEDKGFKRKTLF